MITIPEINSENSSSIKIIEKQSSKTKRTDLIKKGQILVKEANQNIQTKINDGKIKIRSKPLHIQFKIENEQTTDNPQGNIRDKITSLNDDLKFLQQRIQSQKEEEKRQNEEKKKQAAEMIQRLRKQKEEFRNKIKFNQINQRLKNSQFTQEAITVMKQHRLQLLSKKREDMQLKIYQNVNRKVNREEENAKNQISYWVKVKELQNKRHHSTKILPKLSNQNPQLGINMKNDLYVVPRKGSLHKKSKSKQDLTDYQELVNKYLERAKARKQNMSDKSPNRDILKNSKINESQPSYNSLKINSTKEREEKVKKIILSYTQNKHKRIGDEYLKQSLLRVNKSPKRQTLPEQNFEDSIELKGNAVSIFKNDKLDHLQKKWQKVLQNVRSQKIDKAKAIEMFSSIQKRLDKLDPQGIEIRLRKKLNVFQELKNGGSYGYVKNRSQEIIQEIQGRESVKNQFQESSEHGI